MPKALVSSGAVIAWCLSLFAASMLFAGQSRTSDTTHKNTFAASAEFARSKTVLTLAEAFQRTLESSAELAAFSHEVAAREAEVIQAGLLPNPELSVETENIAGNGQFSGLENAETTIRVNQRFELGGKRGLRRELGVKAHMAAQKEFNALKRDVLSKTAQRFYAVLSAQAQLALAEEQIALAGRVLETVKKRVASGKSAAVETFRFQRLLHDAQMRRKAARHSLLASRTALASCWGAAAAGFEAVDGDLDALPPLPSWTELEAKIGTMPAPQAAGAATAVSERAVELADAGRIPDLSVGLGMKNVRETGDNAAVIEVAIPLPFFDRNQGDIRAARERLLKSREHERRIKQDVRTALADYFHRLQALTFEAETLRHDILPAAEKSFDAVSYGYQSGKYGYLEVLDAEQSLFEAKSRYLDALGTYHQLYAQMTKISGWKADDTVISGDAD